MHIDKNTKIPQGKDFAPFLSSFVSSNHINLTNFARGLGCSVFTLERLMNGRSLPTDRAHAEFSLAFILITAKDLNYYLNLSQKDKSKLVSTIAAGGGSALTVWGMITLISSSGVVGGLSAAGITSGLAAIGGSMLGGIVAVAAAPVLVGATIFWGVSKYMKKQNSEKMLYAHKDSLDTKWEC